MAIKKERYVPNANDEFHLERIKRNRDTVRIGEYNHLTTGVPARQYICDVDFLLAHIKDLEHDRQK